MPTIRESNAPMDDELAARAADETAVAAARFRAAVIEHPDADTLLKFVDDGPGQVNLPRPVYRRLGGGHRTGQDETLPWCQ